jgi:hypothetical protein
MNFIHQGDWRNTPVSKEWLVSQHLDVSAIHISNEHAEIRNELRALSEIVQAMLLRMPDDDLRAVAETIGFRAAEEGKL